MAWRGVHPVDVAAQRVDFAVVRDVAIRMRAFPAGKRVRAETRVHQRQRGLHRGIRQVGIILPHLLASSACPCRRASCRTGCRRRTNSPPGTVPRSECMLGALADDVKLALERQRRRSSFGIAADEHLAHDRLARLGRGAQRGIVRRHRPPAENALAFVGDDFLERVDSHAARWPGSRGRNTMPTPYSPGPGKVMLSFLADQLQKLVRHLDQNARAVAGVGLATARAAMVEVDAGSAAPPGRWRGTSCP